MAPPNVIFLDYDWLCSMPGEGLAAFARAAALEDPSLLTQKTANIRPPARYTERDFSDSTDALVSAVRNTHDSLLLRCDYGTSGS